MRARRRQLAGPLPNVPSVSTPFDHRPCRTPSCDGSATGTGGLGEFCGRCRTEAFPNLSDAGALLAETRGGALTLAQKGLRHALIQRAQEADAALVAYRRAIRHAAALRKTARAALTAFEETRDRVRDEATQ